MIRASSVACSSLSSGVSSAIGQAIGMQVDSQTTYLVHCERPRREHVYHTYPKLRVWQGRVPHQAMEANGALN